MDLNGAPLSKFKVALVQMKPKPNDPEANFNHPSNEIRKAVASSQSSAPVSLAILPEYHLTAFDPSSAEFIPACQTSHKYIELYQSLARELNINICPGTIVLTPEPEDPNIKTYSTTDGVGPTLLNTSFFIDNKGQILGSYTKTNLWHPERDHLTSSVEHSLSGNDAPASFSVTASSDAHRKPSVKPSVHEEQVPPLHQVIQTPLGLLGILICWDLAFPEAFRTLILAGAKIILIPTFWMFTDMSDEGRKYNTSAEKLFLQTTLTSRAFENTCAVIFCNAGGPEDEGYIGISRVALPIVGPVEGSFEDGTEGVGIAEVDMEIVEAAERNYKVREDLQRDDWHYGYEKRVA